MTSAPLLDGGDATLFPKLTDAQIALLARHGEVRKVESGEVLFASGDATYDVMVVLEGSVSVLVGSGKDTRELARQGPRDLMVELNVFTGQGTEATGIVQDAGSVLAVPAADFRELVGRELSFGDFVLQTLFRRRQALERLRLGIRIVGSPFDRDTQRLREFAVRNRLLHEWVDVEDPRARGWLTDIQVADTATPVVLLAGERYLVDPSNQELARAVGLRDDAPVPPTTYDLVVVGGGPGGLGGECLRGGGGPIDVPARRGRGRRPGRHVRADRELPRLPCRGLRRRARGAFARAGREVRCADPGALPRRRAGRAWRLPRRGPRGW
jgi:CRP-like cAMP-binding protein